MTVAIRLVIDSYNLIEFSAVIFLKTPYREFFSISVPVSKLPFPVLTCSMHSRFDICWIFALSTLEKGVAELSMPIFSGLCPILHRKKNSKHARWQINGN